MSLFTFTVQCVLEVKCGVRVPQMVECRIDKWEKT